MSLFGGQRAGVGEVYSGELQGREAPITVIPVHLRNRTDLMPVHKELDEVRVILDGVNIATAYTGGPHGEVSSIQIGETVLHQTSRW